MTCSIVSRGASESLMGLRSMSFPPGGEVACGNLIERQALTSSGDVSVDAVCIWRIAGYSDSSFEYGTSGRSNASTGGGEGGLGNVCPRVSNENATSFC